MIYYKQTTIPHLRIHQSCTTYVKQNEKAFILMNEANWWREDLKTLYRFLVYLILQYGSEVSYRNNKNNSELFCFVLWARSTYTTKFKLTNVSLDSGFYGIAQCCECWPCCYPPKIICSEMKYDDPKTYQVLGCQRFGKFGGAFRLKLKPNNKLCNNL